MPRYKYVLFDADNTLFDFYRAEQAALCDALAGVGVQATPETVAAYSRINDRMWKMLERGEITKTALRLRRFEEFCQCCSIQADAAALAVSYTDHLAEKSFLMPGALQVCEALAPHCEMYIITNGIQSVQLGRFRPSPLAPFFRDIFISEELGFEKPHREYFERATARIPGFDPHEAIVIGDSLTSDMAGGIAFGVDTCWVSHKGKTPPPEMPITYTVTRLEDVVPLVLGA